MNAHDARIWVFGGIGLSAVLLFALAFLGASDDALLVAGVIVAALLTAALVAAAGGRTAVKAEHPTQSDFPRSVPDLMESLRETLQAAQEDPERFEEGSRWQQEDEPLESARTVREGSHEVVSEPREEIILESGGHEAQARGDAVDRPATSKKKREVTPDDHRRLAEKRVEHVRIAREQERKEEITRLAPEQERKEEITGEEQVREGEHERSTGRGRT